MERKRIGRPPKHGASCGGKIARIYREWSSIKRRCLSPLCASYKHYGAVGISICDDWRNSFEVFRDWALSNGYSDSLQIDRIDNSKGYSPTNCRWVTSKQNAYNRRNSIQFGNWVSTSDVAKKLGMSRQGIRYRIKSMGLSTPQAANMPKLFGGNCKFFRKSQMGKWVEE